MKQRGFIQLQLAMYALLAVAIVSGVAWFIHTIREGERAEQRRVNEQVKAERREAISDIAVKLGEAQTELHKERTANEALRLDIQREREKHLPSFVPKVAGSDSCIRVGWVRYTNAAAAGVPVGVRPGPGVAEAPAGVGTDSVAATVARNYDKYHECKAAVAGILKEFDTKREVSNARINAINERVKRAERRLQ